MSVASLSWPTDWAAIFGREAPLVIEVGFGNAQFLVDMARRRPEINLLGLEISLPSMRKGEVRVEKAKLDNVRLLPAKAEFVMWALCPTDNVRGLVINFPDPWPKAAHHHRRLIDDHFLHLAATRLVTGGPLDVATDHEGYAEWINHCLHRSPYFDSRLSSPFVINDDERMATKYERMALAEGHKCFYFKWRRNETFAPNDFSIPQELPMPHVVLNVPMNVEEIGLRFEPCHYTNGDQRIHLIDLYWSSTQDSLVVDTYIHEKPFEQRILLAVSQRRSGDYLVHIHDVGFPRSTDGVHFAILSLAEWICGLHEEASIVRHNLRKQDFHESKELGT